MEKLDATVQEGNVLLGTSTKYAAGASGDGISAEDIQSLTTTIADATTKDTMQKTAMQTVADLTAQQNKGMERGLAHIRKTQNAAKAAFGENDRQRMKEFHVGGNSLTTVKAMVTELSYMKSTAATNKTELAKSGFKDADLTEFDTITQALSDVDVKQENAKKVQKNATTARDEAMNGLRGVMKKIRNTAKVIFAGRKDVLVEFEPIPAGRSAAVKKEEPVKPAGQ